MTHDAPIPPTQHLFLSEVGVSHICKSQVLTFMSQASPKFTVAKIKCSQVESLFGLSKSQVKTVLFYFSFIFNVNEKRL